MAAGLLFEYAVEKARVPRVCRRNGGGRLLPAHRLKYFFYRLGVNVTGIFATSAVAAAVIGFALQDMLGNIASGIAHRV